MHLKREWQLKSILYLKSCDPPILQGFLKRMASFGFQCNENTHTKRRIGIYESVLIANQNSVRYFRYPAQEKSLYHPVFISKKNYR